MPKNKSPCPGGFTTDFYQAHWPILKGDIWVVVEDSKIHSNVLPSLNTTFLSLIPEDKVEDSINFHPIALYNVIFKIITKFTANHLKPLLPSLISTKKTGCVEGRQILDYIILSYEVIHFVKTTKSPGMLLKLDISKAFNKLNWKYLQHTLNGFGFSQSYIKWVLSLTSSDFFFILINGSPSRTFSPSCDVRQGSPLSPFLFILMVEGLRRSIKTFVSKNKLKGI
jgi:hypothetical protein